MPKYWGKQIFAHGRFPEVGQKQKTEKKREDRKLVITMAKLCMAHASRLGQKNLLFGLKLPYIKGGFSTNQGGFSTNQGGFNKLQVKRNLEHP